jgi:hypothetical protein
MEEDELFKGLNKKLFKAIIQWSSKKHNPMFQYINHQKQNLNIHVNKSTGAYRHQLPNKAQEQLK